jgi:hypothetical protein
MVVKFSFCCAASFAGKPISRQQQCISSNRIAINFWVDNQTEDWHVNSIRYSKHFNLLNPDSGKTEKITKRFIPIHRCWYPQRLQQRPSGISFLEEEQ